MREEPSTAGAASRGLLLGAGSFNGLFGDYENARFSPRSAHSDRRFWFHQFFEREFKLIKGGWTSSKVRQILGEPIEVEEMKIPEGSAWGTQPAMAHKIQAGEPVRQWIFQGDGFIHYAWFARVGGDFDAPWRVSLKMRVSRRL